MIAISLCDIRIDFSWRKDHDQYAYACYFTYYWCRLLSESWIANKKERPGVANFRSRSPVTFFTTFIKIESDFNSFMRISIYFMSMCRDYEIDPDQEPSLHQLTWCERNINHSLERVIARKVSNRAISHISN